MWNLLCLPFTVPPPLFIIRTTQSPRSGLALETTAVISSFKSATFFLYCRVMNFVVKDLIELF